MYNNGLNNNGMNMGIDYNGGNGMMMNGMSAMPGQQPVMMQPGGQQPQMYAQQPQQYMAPQQPQMVAPQQQQQQQFAPIPSYKATVQPATAGY